MAYLVQVLQASFGGEEGQDLVEYALILVLIVIVVAAVLPTLTATLIDVYYNQVAPALGG